MTLRIYVHCQESAIGPGSLRCEDIRRARPSAHGGYWGISAYAACRRPGMIGMKSHRSLCHGRPRVHSRQLAWLHMKVTEQQLLTHLLHRLHEDTRGPPLHLRHSLDWAARSDMP